MFLRQCTTSSPVSGLLYIDIHVTPTLHGQEGLCGCTCVNGAKYLHHLPTSVHALTDVPHISQAPVLMLRPRAWNMVEHNMMVGAPFLFLTQSNLFINGSKSVY